MYLLSTLERAEANENGTVAMIPEYVQAAKGFQIWGSSFEALFQKGA